MEEVNFAEAHCQTTNTGPYCALCGAFDNVRKCSACSGTWYCSKDHQKLHWKRHKPMCKQVLLLSTSARKLAGAPPSVGLGDRNLTSFAKEQNTEVHSLTNASDPCEFDTAVMLTNNKTQSMISASGEGGSLQPVSISETESGDGSSKAWHVNKSASNRQHASVFEQEASVMQDTVGQLRERVPATNRHEDRSLVQYIATNLVLNSVCVVDKFLGEDRGSKILEEVKQLHRSGVFKDGELVSQTPNSERIRSDKITWVDGSEHNCSNIAYLISTVDAIIQQLNHHIDAYSINGRTKAMVACYPGNGTRYVRHIDNPHNDGRVITSIYYLNKNWNAKETGGLLRIYPEGQNRIAEVEPLFDRLLFFWSDRRNPHEVQPAYAVRYAVTVWYFDETERRQAMKKYRNEIMERSQKE